MEKTNFLLEIGCEDLPDWTGRHFEEHWLPRFREALDAHRLECEETRLFATPRRLILYCKNIDARQKDIIAEVTGPPSAAALDAQGNYTAAAVKFAEAHGASVSDLGRREKKGREFLAVVKQVKGAPAEEIIGEAVTASLSRVETPRAMRWDGASGRFIRPVRWVAAVLGGKKISLTLFGVISGGYTYGHRVLSPRRIRIVSARDYFDKITKSHVVFDPAVRSELLTALLEKIIPPGTAANEADIRSVTLYVEYPRAALGTIAPRFAGLPGEVLCAVISKLKAIPLYEKGAGSVASRFALVFDGTDGEEIRVNYEKVIEDKLDDAHFFMEQDLKQPLVNYSENLGRIAYHPRWGSVAQRVDRFVKMASFLSGRLNLSAAPGADLLRAAALCKNDLATQMVAEFASLQGVMGRIYAEVSGENAVVCAAVGEHYRPRFPGDALPESAVGALLSVIDKTEMICGRLLDGAELSGSGDPYGLKRAMSGIIEIIWKKNTAVPLKDLVKETLGLLDAGYRPETAESVGRFILQRTDNLLAGEGVPVGIRRGVLAVEQDDLLAIRRKIDALKDFLSREGSRELFVPFTRVANILKQAREKGSAVGPLAPELLTEGTEKYLYKFYLDKKDVLKGYYDSGDYAAFLEDLRAWRAPVDKFFDDVMVMCPEEDLRANRLALLKHVDDLFGLFADFSCMEQHCCENTVSEEIPGQCCKGG